MRRHDGMGLVCAGGVRQSFLARMPVLLRQLGPIKASTFRISRQMANALRAGTAASHYSMLEDCPLLLVWVPETRLDRVLCELVARTPLREAPHCSNMVVLCGCVRDSLAPGALLKTGARVATLNAIPDSGDRIFVAEGHPATLRRLRGLLAQNHRKLICLKPGTKPLFFAGIQAGAPLLLPWIASGIACLRAAGFSRMEAVTVGETLGVHTLRQYVRAGEKSWTRIMEADLRRALAQGVPEIRAREPKLAELYEEGIRLALRRF